MFCKVQLRPHCSLDAEYCDETNAEGNLYTRRANRNICNVNQDGEDHMQINNSYLQINTIESTRSPCLKNALQCFAGHLEECDNSLRYQSGTTPRYNTKRTFEQGETIVSSQFVICHSRNPLRFRSSSLRGMSPSAPSGT